MKRKIAALLCLPVLLAGCADAKAPETQQEPSQQIPPSQGQTVPGEMRELFPLKTAWNGCGNDKGFYFISPWESRQTGRKNLLYADYETKQILPLCADPGCAHDSPSCTSFVSSEAGSVLQVVMNDQLLLFHSGVLETEAESGQGTAPFIESRRLDGSEPKTIWSFASGQRLRYFDFNTDGPNLYFTLSTVSEQNEISQLMCFDLQKASCEPILTLDAGESVEGCANGKLLLHKLDADSGKAAFYELDKTSGERKMIFEWNDYQMQMVRCGETAYYWDRTGQDPYFHRVDLAGGKDRPLTQYPILEEPGLTVSLCDYDSEHLLIQEHRIKLDPENGQPIGDGGNRFVYLNTQTGEMGFTESDDPENSEPVQRYAETPDGRYFVRVNNEYIGPEGSIPDGVEPLSRQQYALISKEDYWSGKQNYQIFEDLREQNQESAS